MGMSEEIRIVSKLVEIPLRDLHIQYVHNVTPILIWHHDMSLATSPHAELLRLIRKYGIESREVWGSRYVAERKNRRNLGLTNWSDGHIRKHLRNRWDTYKSMARTGFKPKLYGGGEEKAVKVLKEPFWSTRFGCDLPWLRGPEIWDGGGRCTAALVLGWETIPAYWIEDAYPNSKRKGAFADKFAQIPGVWTRTGVL